MCLFAASMTLGFNTSLATSNGLAQAILSVAQNYTQQTAGSALQALCAVAARSSNDAAVRNMTG